MVVLTQKDQAEDSSATGLINTSSDAPPAYEDLISHHNHAVASLTLTNGEKGRSTSSIWEREETGISANGRRASSSSTRTNASPTQAKATILSIGINKNWFSWFSEKDTRKEVKQTIQSLIKDVTKDPKSLTAACVLQSCLEACQSKGLSFQSIISEKFMEGHCPIYWAIAKRPPKAAGESEAENSAQDTSDNTVELLDILLSMPLNSTTRLEAYSACLLTSDNTLFQRLRSIPDEQPAHNLGAKTSISPDELLLGESPGDEIQVFNGDADYGEFRVIWDIAHFQRRMRAIGNVSTQVIARGHIWHLSFVILQKDNSNNGVNIKSGTWVVCVSLVEPSPASPLYAQVRIPEPEPVESTRKSPKKPSAILADETGGSSKSGSPVSKFGRKNLWSSVPKPASGGNSSSAGSKPPIILSLKTDFSSSDDVLEPVNLSTLQDSSTSFPFNRRKSLVGALDKHQSGYSLQFDGSSYLNPKGTLRVIFEANLSKRNTGNDCVIC